MPGNGESISFGSEEGLNLIVDNHSRRYGVIIPMMEGYVNSLGLKGAIGVELPEMPLFLDPGWYVNVPLEATYQISWKGVPERWRKVVHG